MDSTERRHVVPCLEHSDRFLWSGIPRQGIIFRPFDLYLIPFSIAWGGATLAGTVGGFAARPFTFGTIIVGLFAVVGLYFIAGRFVVDAYARSRTYYGLTDRRVIIISGMFNNSITSLPLINVGTITIGGSSSGKAPPGFQWPGVPSAASTIFGRIPDAGRVHAMLIEAQREATDSNATE
jgi:hypothetical protein